MTNLFTCLSKKSLSLENGSGMHRDCIGDGPAVLRKLFASIIFLLSLGVGNVWGAVGGTLKTYNTNSSTFKTGYARQAGDNFVWYGQKNYYGANKKATHDGLKPTAADLPVVKAQNASATTTTTGYYWCYTSESVSNVGAIQITFSAKDGSSTVNAYVVTSSTAASSGSATWTKLTLLTGSPSAQGANVASAGTYTFTFPKETTAKYYGVVFVTSSYWRATGFQMKLLEGCTAPTAVAKGDLTSSSFALSITDAQNAGNYDVYFSTSSTAPTASTAAGSFSTVDTKTPTISSGVAANATYYVWARSAKTVSSVTYKSAWVALTGNTLTTPAAAVCDAPSAPTNSSVSATGVTFTEGTSGNYHFYCNTTNSTSGATSSTYTTVSGTSKDTTGLSYGTTYYYWARKDCGGGSTSSWVAGSGTTFTTTCPNPTSISAGTITKNGATFTITDNNSPKINSFGSGYGYDIYWNTSSTPAPDGNTTPSATTEDLSKTVTGLTAGTTYYYWVRGKGPNAKSSWVSGGNFTTLHEYTLSYKETDGTANGSGTVVENATSFTNTSAPSKTGHDLEGFYAENTLTTKVANSSRQFVANVSNWTGTGGAYTKGENANLYLKWTPQTYTISSTLSGCSWETDIDDASYEYTGDADAVSGTVNPSSGKGCPSSITVTMGGSTLTPSTDYTWSVNTAGVGTFLLKKVITGNVVVTISAQPMVKWMAGGQVFASKIGTAGTALTNPGTPDNSDYCDGTKVFVGWSATNIGATPTNNQPSDLFTDATSKTIPAGGATYYAVFAASSGTPSTSYAAITSGLASGNYVLAYSFDGGTQIVLENGPDGGDSSSKLEGYNLSLSTEKYSNPGAAYIWQLQAQNDGSYYIYNLAKGLYVNAATNNLTLSTTPTKFTIAYDGTNSRWTIRLTSSDTYYMHGYVNKTTIDWRSSTSGSDSRYRVYLYKNEGTQTFSGYVTTCGTTYTVTKAGSPAGTVTGGTFTATPATAIEDATITLSATPGADYRFGSWTITNTSTTADLTSSVSLSGQTASATFSMPAANVTVTPTFVAKCQTPTFSVSEGTYNNDQLVTITCATSSATIKYTTDGSDPATYGKTYSGQVTINADNTTLKAVAIKAGHENSEVASATYRLKCATPTFTASPGLQNSKYLGTQTVTLATTTTGSITYYYTTGATPADPTESSTEYEDGIEVSSTATVKAIATKSGYQNSDVGSASYTITAAHTVTWMNQNDAVNPLKTERVENGAAPTAFPTESKSGCNSYTHFYGWAEDNFTTPVTNPNSSSTIKVYRDASELPNESSDVTYYAVWADAAPGWTKASSIAAGDVVIIVNETNYREIKSLSTSSSHADTAIYATTPRGVCPFTVVAASTSGFLFKTSDNKYATAGSGNYLYKTEITALSPENDDQRWTVTFDNGDARILNTGYDTRYIRYNSAQPRFAAYAKSDANPYGSQNPVQLYKYSDVNCVTKCCTPLDDINGDKTSLVYNGVTLTWDDIDHVTAWTVTGVDGSSVAVPAGNIGTPTDEGSTYSCAITGLSQYTDYTFTITPTPADGYCDASDEVIFKTPCVAPSSLSISSTGSKWDFCAGESMTLTVSGTNVSGSATYQWQKYNSSTTEWDDIDGAESASYAVASMAASNAGQYRCTVTNPGSSCDATTSGVWVRLWQLYINNGTADAWQSLDFSNTNTGTGSNTTVFLTSDKGYKFKLKDNTGGYFGLNSKTVTTTESNITLNGTGDDVNVTSGLEGNYTFAIDYASSGTKDNPKISITYPVANQANNRNIWFDKSVITGWTDAGTSDIFYRIGTSTGHTNNTKTGGTAWTLVPGTDRFYTTKTMAFNGFEVWQIANNIAWCDDSDDSHDIYVVKPNSPSTTDYDITRSIVHQKYVVGEGGVTLVPTTKKNTDSYGCDYWYVTKTDGMLKHTATITAYSHGTVTVAYTKYDGTGAANFTSGSNDDLAHRCILTITAVADAGYQLTSLQVNSSDIDSGDEHILDDDATITAVFTAQMSTVTLKPNGGSGSDQTVTATYDASMPGTLSGGGDIVKPSRDNYSFTGYFDNTSGGTQYYTSTLTSAKIWDKTGAQNLYAQWQGDSYTITFKDKGDNAYSGSNGGSLPTSHTYGAATALVDGVKTGYHFDGWYTDASCTAGNEVTSIDATAITASTTYYAKWTIENYDVTWMVNGENYTTGDPSGNADYNTQVSTLPTAPSAPEGCSDKVFKGWSTSNLGKTTGQSAPADLFTTAGGSPTITAATTFYAVWADETPESSTTTWTKQDNTTDYATGTYIIVTKDNYAFNGIMSSGHGQIVSSGAVSFTANVATSIPSGAQELTLTRIGTKQYRISMVEVIEDVPTTKYLYAKAASSGNLSWTTESTEYGTYYWYNSDTGGPLRYHHGYGKSGTDYAYLRTSGTTTGGSIRTYGNAGGDGTIYLVKKGTVVTPASWNNYVTECDAPAECGTPTFSVDAGTYTEVQTVTISTVTDGATIRYTTDGTAPTSSSGTVYSEPVEIGCTTTLKAIAYKDGREDSEVGSVAITIKVPDPTFSVNSGTYYAVQNVTLSCDLDGATIYYETTNDGTDPATPTSSSTEYTGAISIPANSTIKVSAIAIKDGCATASDVVTKTYVVRVGTNYTLVTDVNDLNEGDKVVIVADNGSTRNAVNTYAAGNDRPSTNDFDFANNEKTAVSVYPLKVGDTYTVQVFELQGGPGAWVFKAVTDDTKKYLGLKDDNTYLKTYTADSDDQTKWTISISTGIAHIANKQRTTRYIEYNSSGSKFACYTSNQTARTKLYSVPTTDPVIKVEGTLSAFAGCTTEASAAQSFYVSGKNLSAGIHVAAPTGYEVSLSSGSGYDDAIDIARVGTAVAKTQVYVRIKTEQSAGSPSGNVVVSVSDDGLSKNVAVSGTVSAADTYIDRMHGNSTTYKCLSYNAPDLDDGDMETGTDCEKNYAIFQGWVAADDINLDGTLKAGATVISEGTSMTASGTTYYSVWEAVAE